MNGTSTAPGRDSIPTHTTHGIMAVDRHDITVRGVQEVLSFDESNVRLVTTAGILNLEGHDLRIHTLNTQDGIVNVTGTLDGVLYENDPAASPTPPAPRRRFGRR